jgi:uncharacterized protein (TIRG00374 family)
MAIFLLFMIAVLPQIGQLKESIVAAKNSDWRWLGLGALFATLTYFASAFSYVALAKVPIRYMITLGVQFAASFANRIIPSGIGGLGLNVDYLIKNGHKPSEAGSVTAANSASAFVSYVILLFVALTINNSSLLSIFSGNSVPYWVLIIVFAALLIIGFIIYKWEKIRSKITKFINEMWKDLIEYRHEPFRMVLAIVGASLVTIFYVSTLYACSHAVGINISFLSAFIAYTVGTLVGAAIPTPGGLGGVEAGLYAAFIGLGYDNTTSFAAIIIYRLFTFWLPILPGYLVFWQFQKRKIV